jgi:GT2 family glycosyltransferase
MSEPAATILIPTRNRPDDLRKCLRLLFDQLPDGFEILICDDSSNDLTKKLVETEFPSVTRAEGPRIGPGANRNTGAKKARGKWIVFLDDDCLPQPGLLSAYVAAMAHGDEVLAGPALRSDSMKDSLLWEAPRSASETELLPPSCNFAIPRKMFLESGGFDERYRVSFEDMEFFARLRHSGINIRYVPGAAVEHPSRPLPGPSSLANRWEARVISSLDFGAPPAHVLLRLPKHILWVILSRYRGRSLNADTLKATAVYIGEYFFSLIRLPFWLKKYQAAPRSAFWKAQAEAGKAPPKFGL